MVNGNSITYDAENRQVTVVDGVYKTSTSYAYDGDGKRVQKTNPNGTTTFVYDAAGSLAAEYSTVATGTSPCLTCYLSTDHLGSTRLVTNENGGVVSRHDFAPFGDEVTGARGAGWGTAADTINQKFTGKERDSESGLDYFGARYYGSTLGRFTSPDPQQASATLFDPQSWNAYSYVWNRPLGYKDPDGRNPLLVTAAVGAGVGALVGGGFELVSQLSRNGGSLDDVKWGKVGTAALGGGVAGGIAGLTLGLGTAAGVTLGVGQTVAINAGANVIGGEVQRQADAALGNGPAPTGLDEAAAIGIDAIAGGAGGFMGGRIADEIYPLPNVKKEIELLKFANRRSTRAARIDAFKAAADQQAARNAVTSGVQGGARTSTYTGWLQILNAPPSEPKGCVSVSDSASGSKFGGCK